MTVEQPAISYDQFMPQPLAERIRIFNEVSAENRAALVRTHVGRWLAANRARLTPGQVAVAEEISRYVVPGLYEEGRDMEQIHKEAEALRAKAEAVFTKQEVMQMVTNYADYIPATTEQ